MDLPETSLLVTFEAIARHSSLRAAADELHLTPSAISHRLKTLEASIGQPLIARSTRHVSITPAGEILLPAARTAIDALAHARQQLDSPRSMVVTIATTDSVAACWLIDRLPAATASMAETEVRILTTAAGRPFDPTAADLAIGYGSPGDWPYGEPVLVADETITPVCSTSRAADIRTVDDLWSQPLLEDANLYADWSTFADQVAASPVPDEQRRPHASYNHSHLALRAAAGGHGVTLAGAPLADDAIERGELVRPLPGLTMETPNAYYLVTSHQRSSPGTARVHAALVEALCQSS